MRWFRNHYYYYSSCIRLIEMHRGELAQLYLWPGLGGPGLVSKFFDEAEFKDDITVSW